MVVHDQQAELAVYLLIFTIYEFHSIFPRSREEKHWNP